MAAELHLPGETVHSGQITEYRFADYYTLKEIAGFGIRWLCGPEGPIMEPKKDSEPFTRRVRAAQSRLELAREHPGILKSNEALRILQIAEGVI